MITCDMDGLGFLTDPKVSPADLRKLSKEILAYNPSLYINKISPRPLLIVSGDKDPIVPIEEVKELENNISSNNVEFLFYKGGHERPDPDDEDRFIGEIYKFFDEHLLDNG